MIWLVKPRRRRRLMTDAGEIFPFDFNLDADFSFLEDLLSQPKKKGDVKARRLLGRTLNEDVRTHELFLFYWHLSAKITT
jgi:hypothetical protein